MSVDLSYILNNTNAVVRPMLLLCWLGLSTANAQVAEPEPASPTQSDEKPATTDQPASNPLAQNADPNNFRTGSLTLIDGSRVPGQLLPTSDSKQVTWLASSFATPFNFSFQAIESIKYPRIDLGPERLRSDEFAIEFTNRDIVYGNITGWDSGFITIKTQSFGDYRVPTESITRLYRVQEMKRFCLHAPKDCNHGKQHNGKRAAGMKTETTFPPANVVQCSMEI